MHKDKEEQVWGNGAGGQFGFQLAICLTYGLTFMH